jgi:CubicO group peptidase (beta-lactamase class C family)
MVATSHRAAFAACVIASLLPAVATRAQEPPNAEAIARYFADYFTPYVGKDIGSASFVVVRGDSVIFMRSIGLAKPKLGIAADPLRTVYQVGSNSKLFVATAAMQLVEQGKLRLDEDVNHYLHDLQIDGRGTPVTMAQLLTHTSGIDDRKLGRTQAREDLPLMTLGAFFHKFPPRRAIPGGVEINYSGNAMVLAAHVVEQISGERFDMYAQRHIFTPIGMRDATFGQPLPDSLLGRRASMPAVPPLIAYPAGGLAMTTADMSRFLIAQLNGGRVGDATLLRPETVALMHAHHFPADSTLNGVAYGFFEARFNGHRALLHTGDYQHLSATCIIPDQRLAFFVVFNPIGELHEPLLTKFANGFAQRFTTPAAVSSTPPSAPVDATTASRYTGTYRDDAVPHESMERFFVGLLFGDGDASVTYDGPNQRLLFAPPSATPMPLTPIGPTRFHAGDGSLDADLAFHVSGENAGGLFVSAGALGAYSFHRINPLMRQEVQLVFLLCAVLVLGLWVVTVAVRALLEHRKRGTWPTARSHEERAAFWAESLAAMCALLGVGGFVVLGYWTPSVAMMTGVPPVFYALPLGMTGASLFALWLPFGLVAVWRRRLFSLPLRVLYTLAASVSLALIPFAAYWRLLGLHL